MKGICTLANDRVFDQLVALLNSIEVALGSNFPVCIIPYDENISRIASEVARRSQVSIYDNLESMESWDNFVKAVWDSHPNAHQRWQQIGSTNYHRFGTHHRFYAFDGPFEEFIYMDADTLLLKDISFIFAKLDNHQAVVYDFQYKDPSHVYEVNTPQLTQVFPLERINTEIFCSGFYASKKDLFPPQQRNWLLEQLQARDALTLYPMAPDQTILNYMMMKSNYSIYNFALQLPKEKRTGNSVTSSHFVAKNNLLYDGEEPITYLHYIGLSSQLFTRICAGENIDFPYRDIFLHYRYLHEPENKPKFSGKPKKYNQPPNLLQKLTKKLGVSHD